MTTQYHWNDIEDTVSSLLINYLNKADHNCAKAVWLLLENDNLNTYKNEMERNQVLVLVLGLVEFVNECTCLIYEDNFETDVLGWAGEAEINSFRVAQLMGKNFEESEEYDSDDLFESALVSLLEDARREIVSCVKKRHQSVPEIMKFIGEFYEPASEQDESINQNSDELRERAIIPINVLEFSEWVDEGMPRRN